MTAADSAPSARRTQRERRAHTRARIIEATIGSLAGHSTAELLDR